MSEQVTGAFQRFMLGEEKQKSADDENLVWTLKKDGMHGKHQDNPVWIHRS